MRALFDFVDKLLRAVEFDFIIDTGTGKSKQI